MAPEIGILVIHGIGNQKDDFANGLRDKVNGLLDKRGVIPGTVVWEPAFWADLLNDKEKELLEKLSPKRVAELIRNVVDAARTVPKKLTAEAEI